MLKRNPGEKCVRAAIVAAVLLCGATAARADVVLDWNRTMLATIAANPFATARYAAITQLAVFEAVNAITGEYHPYLGTITAPPGASVDAAAAQAAHDVLLAYFPLKVVALDAALAASLAAIPDGTSEDDGVAVGRAAAAAMIALRANDGSTVPPFTYAPSSSDPGQWQATPSCGAAALGTNYHWQYVTPFALPSVQDFRAETAPLLTSGDYAKAYNEVKTVGAADSTARTQDRTDVARFYGSGLSPVGWSNLAAQQIVTANPQSVSENARAFALINIAVADASFAVFDSKYYYTAWRPETAIAAAAADGNAKTDPAVFTPLITAPCFPGYPSAHGTLSSAAAEVLQALYGASGHDLTFSAASVPGIVLQYSNFKTIVADISDARVFGGIHFRFDQDGGERQGERIGQYIAKNMLRPVHP